MEQNNPAAPHQMIIMSYIENREEEIYLYFFAFGFLILILEKIDDTNKS
jgi:hypothetical protein